MVNFWKVVNKVINDSDVVLLLLDSRAVKETKNKEIEDKVKKAGKPLIYVFTKCDLIDQKESERLKQRLRGSVFVSATKHYGTTMLREKILIEAQRAGIDKQIVKVGVLGYPNVGKSSLINAMKGRKAAKASSQSGLTRGVQKIRADTRIIMLDTPGVIPYMEKDTPKHGSIGAIDANRVRDPDLIVLRLLETNPGKFEKHYGVDRSDDLEEVIAAIAFKLNMLKKGGKADIERASRYILRDWQKGVVV